jgi:dihydropteroate synthase
MQKAPAYADVTGAVLAFFESRMRALTRAGLPESRIALDPGIGFGKSPAHNLELMRNVTRLASLGRPLYYGISRKGFFASLLGIPLEERDGPTQAACALLAARGVCVHRVHDVKGCVRALALAAALDGTARPEDEGT